MLEKVEDAVRVTQNNDLCVAETLAAARCVCNADAKTLPISINNTKTTETIEMITENISFFQGLGAFHLEGHRSSCLRRCPCAT